VGVDVSTIAAMASAAKARELTGPDSIGKDNYEEYHIWDTEKMTE